jgi:hypothetical protein
MHVVETDKTPYSLVTRRNRSGRVQRKFVREGEVSPGVGFTADLVWYEGGHGTFSAPRHRHDFDQIRYIVSGRPDFGDGNVAGDGQAGFFPAGAHYGPETIQEAEVMLIQWSKTWVTREQHDATYAEMLKVGEFRDGYYITVDADGAEHRADGRNAVWETFYQRKMTYPTARYPRPVIMVPEAFYWRDNGNGVSVKMLGRFTEEDVYIAEYQWQTGGALALTPERMQLLWLKSGQLEVGGVRYHPRTVIFSDFGETVEVSGTEAAEGICFGMPIPAAVPAVV